MQLQIKYYFCTRFIQYNNQSKHNESTLDNTSPYCIECIHDIRMVWPP